jgi:hypothetical protein
LLNKSAISAAPFGAISSDPANLRLTDFSLFL